MPRMDEAPATAALAKPILIGDGKCGKSDWAARAAMAGFNVLYFDGDVAQATINNMIKEGRLTKEAARRIYLISATDKMDGGSRSSDFYDTLKEFISTTKFRWNDSAGRLAKRNDTGTIWEISPGKLDSSVVVVLDSWTSLCESISLAAGIANSVNIADATTSEMRPVYQSAGLKASEFLQVIRSMRCHVVCVAHPDEYAHKTPPAGKKIKDVKETEMVIDWTKLIPKSVSKPHSLNMSKYFTDILWFQTNAGGTKFMVNARLDPDKVSGGHWTDLKDTEEYSFVNLVKQIGGAPPVNASVDSWLRIEEVGAPVAVAGESAASGSPESISAAPSADKILDGTKPQVVKTGMASMFKKPT